METKVFKSGNSLAVRLPKGYDLPCGKVNVRLEGESLVIERIQSGWPDHFFEDIRIEDLERAPLAYTEKKL